MDGIIIAADANQEWLLPWWWHHYSQSNSYPVVIFDLGMTKKAVAWCKKKGDVVQFPLISSFRKEDVPSKLQLAWEKHQSSHLWKVRSQCLQKPFIFSASPFEKTVWLDIDCMVRGALGPLFHFLNFGMELAIVANLEPVQVRKRERGLIQNHERNFNTGVVAYTQNAKFLNLWTQLILKEHFHFMTDEEPLAKILAKEPISYFELPPLYNWFMGDGSNAKALIHHYASSYWKMAILKSLRPQLGENPILPPLFDPHLIATARKEKPPI